ncbi:MAG TPA: NAD-binding protein [Longimicrobiales bacterium]|nr:NAD-binding protein [Longimicrobiales bacterium]
MEPSPRQVLARAFWRPFVWRGMAFLLVCAAGLSGLFLGAGVSERDLTDTGLAGQAYYVLGLFVLGGLDIGTPAGGPAFARALLWTAYFAAPVITASALIEAAVRLIRPLTERTRALADHVVLGGAGRLTMVYIRKLRGRDMERQIVVVERDPGHPSLAELRDVHRAQVVIGDITHDAVLDRLALGKAHRVLFLTGEDFANLDAAAKVLDRAPNLAGRMVAHVADLGFLRETAGSRVARDCETFNGHEFAAMRLVQDHLLARFRETPDSDVVVLAGFGRFGQTVLRQLQEHAAGSFGSVVVIDERAHARVRVFAEYPGFDEGYEHTVLEGDILDPEIWHRIGSVIRAEGREPVIVLGSGEDGINLQAALMARKRHPGAYVIVRTFRLSPFTGEISREAGLHAFHLGGLIASGMPERWL